MNLGAVTAYLPVMSAVPQVAHRYTIAEYLGLEEETGEKWEFFDGEVFRWDAMTGAKTPHNRIGANASRALDNAITAAKRPCGSLTSDQKLSVVRIKRYRYPDLMVVCGKPRFDSKLAHALLNPSLVLEVVSESSRYMDYTKKLI